MPAAAVIPAPRAYIKVAAVKKLVVGCRRSLARRSRFSGAPLRRPLAGERRGWASPLGRGPRRGYFE